MNNILDFYIKQGERTKVEPSTFECLPKNIEEITSIIRGLGVHPVDLDKIGFIHPKERIADRYLKTTQEVIDKIKLLDNSDLTKERELKNKIVITCKHFAMLICSILREQNIAARCRCGFATYFSNGWFEDHWICEYWNGTEWARIDAQMDKLKTSKKQLEHINFNNMPKDIFFIAGILWQLFRKGLISGDFCGYSPEKGENGSWYIRGNMLRDFYGLNKIEYSYQEINKLMDRNYNPTEQEMILLDEIADLTINIDNKFDEFLNQTVLKKLKSALAKNI